MEIKSNKQTKKSEKRFSFLKVRITFIVCLLLSISILMIVNAFWAYVNMKQTAQTVYQSASAQISEKVDESLKVLESLASLEIFYEPDVEWEEKVAKLDKINEYYGYMFICYVDKDILVYTLGEEPASLASREHMQKVYASKQPYVTDSFVAGADGKTLNYTVIVPLMKDGVMTGSLFATINLDETSELLEEITSATKAEAVLIGSKGQVMCATNNMTYGASILDIWGKYKLLDVTVDQLEENMLNRQKGAFQSREGFRVMYTQYGPIESANWDILIKVDYWSVFSSIIGLVSLTMAGIAGVMAVLYYFVARHVKAQSQTIENMVNSVQEIKKKVYQGGDFTDQLDYENFMHLSGKGLNDELTGTFTRAVFMDQAEMLLKDKQDDKILALCFIDLDDLKTLNDMNGHSVGDTALRKVGGLLREYAVKYDGIVGRYGGDEFILILCDIDNHDELDNVLQELVGRLKFAILHKEQEISIHCSIGASVWREKLTLAMLIANADKALYDVKRHGKANYSLFLNGDCDEI